MTGTIMEIRPYTFEAGKKIKVTAELIVNEVNDHILSDEIWMTFVQSPFHAILTGGSSMTACRESRLLVESMVFDLNGPTP